ncbi:MAG TPA: GntR family transcriptional regulator [Microvirga sp.]|nr:GntR family transcriptional regulator [Microvirga sp.]
MLEGADDSPLLVRTSVYQRLRAAILSCALRPGAQLQERQLAELYQVSKSPIRDALLKLEEQNLVEVMPRKGYRVKRISLADARELYEMRQIFERESIVRLIETADSVTLAGLDQFRTLPSQVELSEWIEYNSAFHGFIAANCGNSRLARAGCEAIEQYERLTYVSVTSSGELSLADFVAEHSAIIDAIQKRDKRQAVALARDHIESSRRRVLDALESMSVIA